jgi:hypothetical protein
VPYFVAANETPARWGQIAVTFLSQSSPAFEHFHRLVEHHGIDYTDVSQLTWNVFDRIMSTGTFGVPPTDRSVRKKLQGFKQRMPLDTASFVNAFLDLCAKAPTPLDSHTKIHFFLEAAHPMLADKYELPPDGGVWRDWEHLYGVVSVNAALYDRQATHMISQQRVTDALAKTLLSDMPLTYAAAAAAGAATSPQDIRVMASSRGTGVSTPAQASPTQGHHLATPAQGKLPRTSMATRSRMCQG